MADSIVLGQHSREKTDTRLGFSARNGRMQSAVGSQLVIVIEIQDVVTISRVANLSKITMKCIFFQSS